jgi:protein-S-isoprenylcysteine O-methyltransferase Ste14
MSNPTPIAIVTLAAVVLCWLAFTAVFLFRKKPPQPQTEAKRDRVSLAGIGLQMIAYALVWFQPPHSAFLPPLAILSGAVGIIVSVFTVGLGLASGLLAAAAVRTLGKQWTYAARLVTDHELVTSGPYAFVRNPIYTSMLGMLIATGLATEHFIALLIALVLFSVGLVIRVRSEEKLLRSAFGEKFDEYAKKVPAVIPGIY